MAHSLTNRMPRLLISSRQFISSSSSSSKACTSQSTRIIGSKLSTPEPIKYQQHGMLMGGGGGSHRYLSSVMPIRSMEASPTSSDFGATSSLGAIPDQTDAENFSAFVHANRHQKVKPFIIKRRRQLLRTYVGNEKEIRHSPWRMNLVCQLAAGLPVSEALKQLMFCQKKMAPLVAQVIRRTAVEAEEKDGIMPSQLEVSECFTTHGHHLKRLKIMGRGRRGIMHRRFSHIRLVLREIDFPTKLLQAESVNAKRKWLGLLQIAREDAEKASIEQDELAELEAMAAKIEEDAKKKREEEEAK